MNKTRSSFTHSNLLTKIKNTFQDNIKEVSNSGDISLVDCFMSALAIFALKYRSLLKFEEDKASENNIKHNLCTLYGIKRVPCDTYLRERLDSHDLSIIREAFSKLFALMQRGKTLEMWKFIDNKYLISLDASGFFSSNNVKCQYCCEKIFNKGTDRQTTLYHHQMLVGSIVSPDMKQVIPVEFEPVIKEDGSKKNDCEKNCAKRWLKLFRNYHPHLPAIIVADALYANAPFIKELEQKRCSYILVAKEDDHKYLYEYFWDGEGDDIEEFERDIRDKNGIIIKNHKYRFMNNVPLNTTNQDLKVNVLYFEEFDLKKQKQTKWLWVTDILITKANAKLIMQGGKSRWKIENETFNTLKNQGYNFEHNFGHGYRGLSNLFAGLMLLAFYIDQILEALNLEFKQVIKKYGSRSNAFEKIRNIFFIFIITSYERLYEAIHDPPRLVL